MGISHQKLGRWLREGQPALLDPETGYLISSAGAKAIPKDATAAINHVFSLHKTLTRDQARADALPYNARIPAFTHRGVLRTGQPGERVFIENTEFIRPELRFDILVDLQKTNRFMQGSLRSTINIKRYFEKTAQDEITQFKRTRTTAKKLGSQMLQSFLSRNNRIIESDELMPLFTRYESMMPGRDPYSFARSIEKKMHQKHEAHALHLADEYLFQLLPQRRNEKPQESQPRRSAPRKTQSTSLRKSRAKK